MTRLIAIALALAPAVAQAQFLPTGMESMPSGKRPAFLFTAPAPGDYATLTTATGQTITCARASTATVQTSASTITSVASGHCAVDYRGLQAEGPSTNLALRSDAFDNAAWSKLGGGASAAPTVTANAAVAPDGTTTADEIDFPAVTSGSDQSLIFQSVTVATATKYTWSIWLKAKTGAGTQPVFVSENAVTLASGTCAVSTSWSRCALTVTSDGLHTSANFLLGCAVGVVAPCSAYNLYAVAAQVEAQPFATSYAGTAGTSVARAGDTVSTTKPATVTMAGASAAYSLSVTARVEGLLTAAQEVVGSNANFVPLFQAETGSANQVAGYSDTVPTGATYSAAGLDALKVSQALRYAMNVSSGKVQACANGSCGSAISVGAQPAEPSTIFLGCFSGGTAPLFGWISAACISRTATGCAP